MWHHISIAMTLEVHDSPDNTHLLERLDKANSNEEIIALLKYSGLNSTADRLAYLDGLAEDDPEEEFIKQESMHRFAIFMLGGHLPAPGTGISPGGLVHAEWRVSNGLLSMDFYPSEKIRFVAILKNSKWKTMGMLSLDHMLKEIEPFRRVLYHEG